MKFLSRLFSTPEPEPSYSPDLTQVGVIPGIVPAIYAEAPETTRRDHRRMMVNVQSRWIAKQIEYMNIDLGNYLAPTFHETVPGGVLSAGQLSPLGRLMTELSAGDHVPNVALGEREPTEEQRAELARIDSSRGRFRVTDHYDKTYVPSVDPDFDPSTVDVVGE